MGHYQELHLANNVDALDLLANRGLFDVKKFKFNQICNALSKLYKESQLHVLDQETTYILLRRYLNLYNQFLSCQTDKKFFELRFGSEYDKVAAQLEQTSRSLEARYASQTARQSAALSKPKEKKVIIDEKPSHIFSDAFITCQQLFSALEAKHNILLVDARPDNDFKQSRLHHTNCINVPENCIASGMSANVIGKQLPEESKRFWDKRDSYDVIVLFDWNTMSINFASTKLDKLRAALVKWDLNRNYREQPVILNGGYIELLQTYPTLCKNPHVYLYQKDNDLDELLELDSITYPSESDNTTPVLISQNDSFGGGDDNGLVTKESLIQENKEITINRQNVITQLLHEEGEWKKINEKCNEETNTNKLVALQEKESEIRAEIERLENTLNDLNSKKDKVKRKIQDRLDDDLKNEELQEIMRIEEDDSEKLKILDVIGEERCRALATARALKPKNDNNVEPREIISRPIINRSTKPSDNLPRLLLGQRIQPLDYMNSGLIGLRNIRNTCYMNTVVQCMRNLPEFVHLFCDGSYSNEIKRNPAAIVHETAGLFRQLWSSSARFIDPQDFYNKIGTLEATYKLGHHEDCMEFFLFLLNHLSEDCSYDISVRQIMTPKQKAWYNQFEGKNSIFIDLFYHQIRVIQSCKQCEQKTFKFEIESTFMLSVPEDDFSLNSLMNDYLADYVITEYCCSKCKRPVINKKEICYEPKIMVIVLKRYRQAVVNGVATLKKIESRAHFEKNRFQLGKRFYRLHAIACHSGDMNFGHYTAAVLTTKGWYEYNDETVKPISINDEALKSKACAFFYSMCDEIN